jgi:hypothetical protein
VTEFEELHLNGSEVQVGDEFPSLWFMQGSPGVVKKLWPYRGALLKDLGEGTQIARFVGTSTEMTLPARTWYTIRRMKAEKQNAP